MLELSLVDWITFIKIFLIAAKIKYFIKCVGDNRKN